MRPSFHPRLINHPFSDPGLFIPFRFEPRALLFDLGELSTITPRDLLKVTHVFVTHTHMDHFIGFDTLLRLFLGRDKTLHLFGPAHFLSNVEGKLSGYSWNLVENYNNAFELVVSEVHPERILTKRYVCQDRFKPGKMVSSRPSSDVLWEESAFSVQGRLLDHQIPCLSLSLTENFYVNIIKEGLRRRQLPVGPWLNRFKAAIYEKRDPQEEFLVTWKERGSVIREKSFVMGDLVKDIARFSPGQKIVYISDVVYSPHNSNIIIDMARGADILFIEAAFLDSERDMARTKYHLTARQAGKLAKMAGVKRFRLFHFSPRYQKRAQELEAEAREAYQKTEMVIGS